MQIDRLDKLFEKVAEIAILLERNTVTLERNTEDMKKHIRRTDLLEKQVSTALIPVLIAKWTVAITTGLGAVGAFVYGAFQFIQKL